MKSRPLSREEVLLLLDQITKRKILTSRATNAASNKLKEHAWKSISRRLTAMAGEPRRPEQLRFKWDNLKKAARKRTAMIQENNLRTEGKLHIPKDEILDRVASLLMISDDKEESTTEVARPESIEIVQVSSLTHGEDVYTLSPFEGNAYHTLIEENVANPTQSRVEDDDEDLTMSSDGSSVESEAHITPKKEIVDAPNSSPNKRQLLAEVKRAQRDKELAIAAYFRAKARNVELENIKLEIEIKRLRQRYK